VVGVTDYCNYPPEASTREKVGGYWNPSVELVENLTPDLILASSGNDLTTVNKLVTDCQTLNCTVVGLKASTLEDITANIRTVARLGNVDSTALVQDITQRVNAVEGSTSGIPENLRKKTFYVIWDSPLYTGGNGTFAHDLIVTGAATSPPTSAGGR